MERGAQVLVRVRFGAARAGSAYFFMNCAITLALASLHNMQ